MGLRSYFGWIINGSFEPIVEVEIVQEKAKIGDFNVSGSKTELGVGALFNLPLNKISRRTRSRSRSLWYSGSKWIPYGGVIIKSSKDNTESGAGQSVNVQDNGLKTNIVGGCRYMVFDHIAINSWIRLSYNDAAGNVESEVNVGGETSSLTIDINLFSLSLLF